MKDYYIWLYVTCKVVLCLAYLYSCWVLYFIVLSLTALTSISIIHSDKILNTRWHQRINDDIIVNIGHATHNGKQTAAI